MKQKSKLTSEQQQQDAVENAAQTGSAPLELNSVEEVLRYDAARTPVPPGIASKLQKSINALPPESKPSWWKRFLGGAS